MLGPQEGTTLLQAGWAVRSGKGLRTSQQTCPSVGAVATGLATETALAGSGSPSEVMVPVLEPKEQTDRSGSIPLWVREGGSPGDGGPRGGSPGRLCLLFLTLLSAVAKIHSLRPCLGANQPLCP